MHGRALGVVIACALGSQVIVAKQVPFGTPPKMTSQGDIAIGSTWEALGPFPSGTREHPFLSSPAYAFLPPHSTNPSPSVSSLDRSFAEIPYGWSPQPPKYRNEEVEVNVKGKGWPSELGVDGVVGWETFRTGEDGYTAVSYPDIRWDQLRAHHGWATLQFQSLLRTNVTITSSSSLPILLEMELIQGQEFALVPLPDPSSSPASASDVKDDPITWYNGDIYSYALTVPNASASPSKISAYAHQIHLSPGTYTLLVKAIFEIRMFGEPGAGNAPIIKFLLRGKTSADQIKITEGPESALSGLGLERREELDLVGDVIDGLYVGTHIGLGMRSLLDSPIGSSAGDRASGSEGVTEISAVRIADSALAKVIKLELLTTLNYGNGLVVRAFPGQMRVLAVSIQQSGPIPTDVERLDVMISARRCRVDLEGVEHCHDLEITTSVQITHVPHFSSPEFGKAHAGIKFTHLSPTSSPMYTMLIPPLSSDPYPSSTNEPTLLALHGAGVEASSAEWLIEVPRRKRGWAVLPTGGTSWGMDWHGASMESALDALEQGRRWIDAKYGGGKEDGWSTGSENILIGHSNGGQGAWHVAARHPDKFLGVAPGAGYLKIQDYVSYHTWLSDNYADPALMGILKSSLTPYNNDLYASNLANVPIHALHGEEDDNVPVSSTRKHVGLVGSWSGNLSEISYEEVPGANHWYPGFFRTNATLDFVDDVPKRDTFARFVRMHRAGYTVTTANPDETSGKGGIRIYELETPGRLARIEVLPWRSADTVLRLKTRNVAAFSIDPMALPAAAGGIEVNGELISGAQLRTPSEVKILSSPRPPAVIYGTQQLGHATQLRSLAVRLAHSAQMYQRIEMDIIDDTTALKMAAMGQLVDRHVIVLGTPQENIFTAWMAADKGLPIAFPSEGLFTIGYGNGDRVIYEAGSGIIFLADHPSIPSSLACVIAGTDAAGLEAAFRLFPIRTGVPIPDWAIVGPKSSWQGAGGFLGAGSWGGDWDYIESMSYLA